LSIELISLSPILKCFIIDRINRFTVRVKCFGSEYLALNTNTGRLNNLLTPGRVAYCIRKCSGKLPLRLLGIEMSGEVAVTDIYIQMKSFEKALVLNSIPWLLNCVIKRRNPVVGSSRLDYLLKCLEGEVWVEVKSALLLHGENYAGYPDCLSLRGRRHIRELIELASNGRKALLVFIVALPSASGFKPYTKGDPDMPSLLRTALEHGVSIKAIGLSGVVKGNTLTTVLWDSELPVILSNA